MKKPTKRSPGPGGAPANPKRRRRGLPSQPEPSNLLEDEALLEQVRRIIDETPEIRPEKVEPLREAVESGTYEIDTRKLANRLITKIILDP
jgi:negative regulator of flagellin synthesis FlgM